MADAFHVEAISWHRGGITLFGETRRLDGAAPAGKPTRMVAWNQAFAIGHRVPEPVRILGWDGVFAFALFLPALFMVELGSDGALLFLLVTFVCAALRFRSLCAILHDRWFVFLLPAWAFVSVLWSEAPFDTLKHSAELAVTVLAALLLASPRNPRAMLMGLFWAFVIYVGASVMAGNMVHVGDTGTRAFSGLGNSKNQIAAIAGAGLLVSVFVFVIGLQARRALLCAIAAAAGVLESLAALAALSAGTLAGSVVALGVLAFLFALRRAGKFARGAVLWGAALCAFSMAAFVELSGNQTLQWLASAFGKDPTLTGRTYLWSRARDLIAEHPLLGSGFGAFWRQGNLDAEGLWQFAGITARTGFNFHNTFYESLVGIGWVGTLILGFTFVVGLARLSGDYAERPRLLVCFWLGLAAYFFIRMPTECIGLNAFYFATVLLYATLGASRPAPGPMSLRRGMAQLAFACRSAARTAPAAAVSATARFAAP